MGSRSAKTFALATLVLGITASGGTAATPARAPMLGVVPHADTLRALPGPQGLAAGATSPAGGPLLLQESPCAFASSPLPCWVMRTNTVYAVYWIPSSYGNKCDAVSCAAYESGIDRYFKDVAHDSGGTSNVYSAATQYYDATGPISYASSFAGSYVDTDPFPRSGCTDGTTAVCLTDQQIQEEIQRVLTAKGWHGSASTIFFLMTPDGVGSCFDGTTGQCTTTDYCAYHSGFTDLGGEWVIYANEPFAATIAGCHGTKAADPGFGHPNGLDVDAELNTISHEHNEAITDPWGNAWLDLHGSENGDICAWTFGSALGVSGGQPYNQLINGHEYSLQQEYSNDGSACVQRYLGIPVSFGPPAVSGGAGLGRLLSATSGTWSQSPTRYAYRWQRCPASGGSCADISGATGTTYRLTTADIGHTVRAEVSAQNAAGTSPFRPSARTETVVPVPASTARPALSGVAGVGRKLFTTTGAWNSTVTVEYQWLRCAADDRGCVPIPGAITATHRLVSADAGQRLEARISATNAAGTAAALSSPSAVVTATPPTARQAPHIWGRARVGQKLSGDPGSWTNSPTAYSYQWLRCDTRGRSCTRISHATRPTYRLTSLDMGHRLRLRVTALNAAGGRRAISHASARVPASRDVHPPAQAA